MKAKYTIITLFFLLLISSCTSNKNKKDEQENLSTNNEIVVYNSSEIKRLNNLIEALKQRLSENTQKDSIPNHIGIISFLNICCSNYINPPILIQNRDDTDIINSYIELLEPAARKDILEYGHFTLSIDEERLAKHSKDIYDKFFESELTDIIFRIARSVQKRKNYEDEIIELNALFYDAIGYDIDPDAKIDELNEAFDRIRERKPAFIKKSIRKQLDGYLDSSPTFYKIIYD